MIFNSIVYLFLFLPLTLILFYLTPMKFRNVSLLIISLLFLFLGSPKYILLILASMAINYLLALIMDARRHNLGNRKSLLVVMITFNVLILFVFKYLGFFVTNVNSVFGTQFYVDRIIQPLGLSFYTFQVISYAFDVYRGQIKSERNPLKLFLYFIMFPQLASGPIMRYGEISPQLRPKYINFDLLSDGMERLIVGLFKKVIIANTLGSLWEIIKAMETAKLSLLTSWVGILAFTFYIYFDFSGYMDMAIGSANLFGIRLRENFNFPYISQSVAEFWRRWHMTLGSWFKDYIYIPMGGSRSGNLILNTMTVWMVTGLWHGASWNFVIWGLYFGLIIILEKYLIGNALKKLPNLLSNFYTMLLVIIGWVIFDTKTPLEALNYIKNLFGASGIIIDKTGIYYLYTYIVIFLLAYLLSKPLIFNIFNAIKVKMKSGTRRLFILGLVLILILSTAYILNQSFSPSMYIGF